MQKGVNWCYNKLAKRYKLLYKQGDIMRRTNRDTKIIEFYKKKKADGLAARSALVASMNKLLRIIHSLCKNGCLFK